MINSKRIGWAGNIARIVKERRVMHILFCWENQKERDH
jgi:hypothetical protein